MISSSPGSRKWSFPDSLQKLRFIWLNLVQSARISFRLPCPDSWIYALPRQADPHLPTITDWEMLCFEVCVYLQGSQIDKLLLVCKSELYLLPEFCTSWRFSYARHLRAQPSACGGSQSLSNTADGSLQLARRVKIDEIKSVIILFTI